MDFTSTWVIKFFYLFFLLILKILIDIMKCFHDWILIWWKTWVVVWKRQLQLQLLIYMY